VTGKGTKGDAGKNRTPQASILLTWERQRPRVKTGERKKYGRGKGLGKMEGLERGFCGKCRCGQG